MENRLLFEIRGGGSSRDPTKKGRRTKKIGVEKKLSQEKDPGRSPAKPTNPAPQGGWVLKKKPDGNTQGGAVGEKSQRGGKGTHSE